MYGGKDPRELPTYSIQAASRHLGVPAPTLRAWVCGRTAKTTSGEEQFYEPLIAKPREDDDRLSFMNLIEAHVLRALRRKHGIRMRAVRNALKYAQETHGIDRLLIHEDLLAGPGEFFLEKYGELISLDPAGQIAIKEFLSRSVERIQRAPDGFPARLFPNVGSTDDSRYISIDPRISSGRPTVAGTGIRTSILVERINAGERINDLAYDYDLNEAQVKAAIQFEEAA